MTVVIYDGMDTVWSIAAKHMMLVEEFGEGEMGGSSEETGGSSEEIPDRKRANAFAKTQ